MVKRSHLTGMNILSWRCLALMAISIFLYGLTASYPHLWILAIPLEMVGLVVILFGKFQKRDLKIGEKVLLLVCYRVLIILSGTPWIVGSFGYVFPRTPLVGSIVACFGIGFVVCAGILLCYLPLKLLNKTRQPLLQLALLFFVVLFWEYGVYLWPASSWLALGFSDYTVKVFYMLGHNGTKISFAILKAFVLFGFLNGFLNYRRSVLLVSLVTAALIGIANLIPSGEYSSDRAVTLSMVQDGNFSVYGQPLVEALRIVDKYKKSLKENPSDIVVWSENFFIGPEEVVNQVLHRLQKEIPAQHIAGSGGLTPAGFRSNLDSILNGEIQRQSKGTAFPIGEYIPFLDLWKKLGIFAPERLNIETSKDFIRFNVANQKEVKFLGLICLDAFNPWLISSRVSEIRSDPEKYFLLEIYNETLFGTARAARQHLSLMRVMAASFRLPMVHAGHAGISAIINADGSISTLMPYEESGILKGVLFF